jgi:acyl-CoA dehydrogenase
MAGILKSIRRRIISAPLLAMYRRRLPPLSDTEREALEAGTVWWDAALFSGRPDWQAFLAEPKPTLQEKEQAFLDGPTEELCRMVDDWRIRHVILDLPPNIWRFIKEHRFLGMIIPEDYGGLGFSALAHSSVVMKIATRSITVAVTVMVPNSLGPAELLLKYGTEAQRRHYLPRLATGEEIPCFALTGPYAGSDAASLPDKGVVCHETVNGQRTLGMRVNWEKRYITLGPIATVMGLAFHLYDPDHVLGGEEDLGITVALVPTDTPGVTIGRRHYPALQAFQNGPNSGTDVFIPMDWVIGGRERVGQGWRMLMESLATGRSISLPSLSTGAVKFCARTAGAYARVRKQFRLPVGKFEGVQEALARIAGHAYLLDAARQITAGAIDKGEKPAVLSAIMKYHATMRMRSAINDAMDVHGGKAVCDGPKNYLSNIYYALPVSITVEGANILTRSLIIFGQGAIRCHPYLLAEMQAAHDTDGERGLADFDTAVFGHLRHQLATLVRAFFHNVTGGRWARAPEAGPATGYYRQLSRASASFALLAEVTLMVLGGALKRGEFLSGRLGDVLSELYLMSCVLKRFEDDGRPSDDLPLVQWCCEGGLLEIERRFEEILSNYPVGLVAWLLRPLLFPFGHRRKPVSDRIRRQCAELLLTPGEARDRLTAGINMSRDPDDSTAQLERALTLVVATDAIEEKIRDALGSVVGNHITAGTIQAALEKGVIGEADARLLEESAAATHAVIMVDDFAPEELSGESKR